LKERVAAYDLDQINIRVKLPSIWMHPNHDLVNLQIIQTILFFLQTTSTFQKKTPYVEENLQPEIMHLKF